MLRAARRHERAVSTKRTWSLVVFSVGGVKLAARTEDVGGVTPWGESVKVPSRTPYVYSLLKRDKDVLPVYDLAQRLERTVDRNARLCMVARHPDGPMAIGIDDEIPSLHQVDAGAIKPSTRQNIETLGSFDDGGEEVAIVAIYDLGRGTVDRSLAEG